MLKLGPYVNAFFLRECPWISRNKIILSLDFFYFSKTNFSKPATVGKRILSLSKINNPLIKNHLNKNNNLTDYANTLFKSLPASPVL